MRTLNHPGTFVKCVKHLVLFVCLFIYYYLFVYLFTKSHCIVSVMVLLRLNFPKCISRVFLLFFFLLARQPLRARSSSLSRFHDHSQTHRLGRIPPDECSTRRRVLFLTTHNNRKRQTSTRPAGFEHTIPASEWPQTPATTGIVVY